MEFRILGSLEVLSDGVVVPIAGRLHPRILAGLLLNAGRTVSVEWLVDLLWDDGPPATAVRQVQNAVAALRRRLEPVRAGLIERIGREYRVNVGDDELDLRRFEELSREARRAAEAGQWAEAFKGFGAALRLWRGSALEGLSGRTLEAAAARLDDKHLSVFEEYAEAALPVGCTETILAELRTLVRANPLRQRLHGRLMHALYQSGQAAEAIRVFESLRNRLADKLGLDPDEQLRQLHIRICQDDPTLTPIVDRSKPSADQQWKRPVPAELPTDVALFTGREEQLTALDRLRDNGMKAGVISAITGIGGVGKTALAVHWGHSRREDFPDGQLYINLRGFDEREPLTPHEGVSRMLRSLGQSPNDVPADLDKATGLYQSLLADRRMFILLDNARTVEQVQPLLPNDFGSIAVVTSRNILSDLTESRDVQSVNLNTLSPDESIELLNDLIGPNALADVDATRQLARLCGHLPLALRIVAANHVRGAEQTLAQLVVALGSGSRLAHLNIDGDAATNISSVFDLSYNALTDRARHLFHYLSLIPGDDFTMSLASALTETRIDDMTPAFEELRVAHLIDESKPGRFQFHDLVRIYAQAVSSREVSAVAKSLAIDHLIGWYSDWNNPLDEEFSNIAAYCDAFSDHPQLHRVIQVFERLVELGNDLELARKTTQKALRIAVERGDMEARVNLLRTMGSLYLTQGDVMKAVSTTTEAAKLLPQIQNRNLTRAISANLGNLLYATGSFAEAEQYIKRAITMAKELEQFRSLTINVANLGRVYRAMGRYRESEVQLLRANALAHEHGREYDPASSLAALANLYSDMGRLAESTTAARKVLSLNAITKTVIIARRLIGANERRQGNAENALEHLFDALQLSREQRFTYFSIDLLQQIAEVYLEIGDSESAQTYLSKAHTLSISRSPDSSEIAQQAQIRCRVLILRQDFQHAIGHAEQARDIYRHERRDPLRLARSLDALALAHQGAGNHAEAREAWTEALAIFTRLGTPEAAAVTDKLREAPDTP